MFSLNCVYDVICAGLFTNNEDMSGILDDIKSLFGEQKSFYDILNIRKEATKDEGMYCNDVVIHNMQGEGGFTKIRSHDRTVWTVRSCGRSTLITTAER